MKKLFILLTAFGASIASAATVSVTSTITGTGNVHGANGAQVALRDAAGTTLPAGMRIRLGFFVGYTTALDATLRAPGGVFSLMSENSPNRFVPLGEPPVRVGYGDDTSANNVTKTVAGSVRWNTNYTNVNYVGGANDPADNNTLATGGVARGTRLFLLVYNTGELNPNTSAAGFQYGLFSADTFLIPEEGAATLNVVVANVDTAGEIFYGALGNSLHTAPIPEPTTGLLALFAGLGLIGRRSRK